MQLATEVTKQTQIVNGNQGSGSAVLFKLKFGMGETMSGNFSTVTFEGSRPKPRSSERLTSFSQKYNFIMILSKNGNSLSWLKYFSITMNWKSPTTLLRSSDS